MNTPEPTAVLWLDQTEMAAWRTFIETVEPLLADLDTDLLNDHGLSTGDYEVFVFLSESPGNAMRMCDLAVRLRLSPSGLTRRLDGLVRMGYVRREPSSVDRRVANAVITDAGMEMLGRAAPDHVDSVRRHFLDHLTPQQMVAIADAFATVARGRQSLKNAAA